MATGRFSCLLSAAVLLSSSSVWADPPTTELPAPSAPEADAGKQAKEGSEPPRNYVNLTMGGSTGTEGPVICAEVAPLAMLAVAACGNGSGVLYDRGSPEIAHFRATLTPVSWQLREVWFQPRLSLGIAEMQVGVDAAGFDFGGAGPTGMETAGPEAGAALRGLWPVYKGLEVVSELSLGLAYFSSARELVRPQSTWQPSATFTLGVGF